MLAARIHAATAELVQLSADLDSDGSWAEIGVRSCAHWLSIKIGVDIWTGGEMVRAGHALEELPSCAPRSRRAGCPSTRSARSQRSPPRLTTRCGRWWRSTRPVLSWRGSAEAFGSRSMLTIPAAPAPRTDGHHVRHWYDGGATDLDNLVHSEYVPFPAGATMGHALGICALTSFTILRAVENSYSLRWTIGDEDPRHGAREGRSALP